MSNTQPLTPEIVAYLKRFPSNRSAKTVPAHWTQWRVEGGVIANCCDELPANHRHALGCAAFYPDTLPH